MRVLDAAMGRMAWVLDLAPMIATARAIRALAMLRHKALKAHLAGRAE